MPHGLHTSAACLEASVQADPVSIRTECASLRSLILYAYALPPSELLDKGDWTSRERYAVSARAKRFSSGPELKEMLQVALRERFGLRLGKRSVKMRVLELVQAPGGRNFLPTAEPPPEHQVDASGATLKFSFRTVSDLVLWLNSQSYYGRPTHPAGASLDQPIIDETGLSGNFAIEFNLVGSYRAGPGWNYPVNLDYSEMLRTQLGLMLIGRVDPFDIFTIERAEAPTAN